MPLEEYLADYDYYKSLMVPISHGDHLESKSTLLRLANNMNMAKQSFVQIDHVYEIPISCLQEAYLSGKAQGMLYLEQQSLDYLKSRLGFDPGRKAQTPKKAEKAQSPTRWNQNRAPQRKRSKERLDQVSTTEQYKICSPDPPQSIHQDCLYSGHGNYDCLISKVSMPQTDYSDCKYYAYYDNDRMIGSFWYPRPPPSLRTPAVQSFAASLQPYYITCN